MLDRYVTEEDIASVLKIHPNTIKTYLGNYMFDRFRDKYKHENHVKDVYFFSKRFIYALSSFLYKRRNLKAFNRFEEYCSELEIRKGAKNAKN